LIKEKQACRVDGQNRRVKQARKSDTGTGFAKKNSDFGKFAKSVELNNIFVCC